MIKEVSYGIIPCYRTPHGEYQILLIQSKAGYRGFPKWHTDKGELPLQTAQRELQEETGLIPTRLITKDFLYEEYIFTRAPEYKVQKKVWYLIGMVSTTQVHLQKKELRAYQRMPVAHVAKKLSFPEVREVFGQAQKILLSLPAHD